MIHSLDPQEQRTVDDLLTWDRTRRKADLFASYFALGVGAFIFFGVVGYTLSHLQEPRVYRATLLGCLGAIALFLVFAFGTHRVQERHRLATIIRKLSDESVL